MKSCVFSLVFLLFIISVSPDGPYWTFNSAAYPIQNFFEDNSLNLKNLIDQTSNVRQIFDSSVVGLNNVKDTVSSYVEDQQKEIKSYIESAKEGSKKLMDSWSHSYIPNFDYESVIENPDVELSVPAIIKRYGYNCETHTVLSQGYMLNIHRIPHSRNGTSSSSKTVLLQHGLFGSSADWIINGPEKSLGYVLAEAGYDVWLANIRGNRYSKEHAWLKTDSKSYWNFSWHEVAVYDVPAIIDYIIKLKGSDTRIIYIGHSMGTAILFAMLAIRPEYNDVLNLGVALAPEVFLSDVRSPLKSLMSTGTNLDYVVMLYGSYEFSPKNSFLGKLTSACEMKSLDSSVCKDTLFYFCGSDEKQFNKTVLPVFMSHFGTGTSWKTIVHFSQEILAGGRFQQFDYGSDKNKLIYGIPTPPEYDLSKVKAPVILFWAQNDLLSSETDVRILYENLSPSTTEMYLVPDPKFNHLDYLWAIDSPTLLNSKILEKLENSN